MNNSKPVTLSATFDAPWPEILVVLQDWIRTQALMAGQIRAAKVELSFARASLLAAKEKGIGIRPAFDDFRQMIWDEWKIAIDPPTSNRGLHPEAPHRVTFSYWR